MLTLLPIFNQKVVDFPLISALFLSALFAPQIFILKDVLAHMAASGIGHSTMGWLTVLFPPAQDKEK